MPSQVIKLLEEGDAHELIGALETVAVEFKRNPYRVDTNGQKQELAKDVCGLANADGGVIVIGFKTVRSESRATDVVSELNAFSRDLLDEQQLNDVMSSWIFPTPNGLTFRFFEHRAEKGFYLIEIPARTKSAGPFLVTRAVDDNERISGALVGVFKRRAATSPPLSVAEIQSVLRDGELFRSAIDERAARPLASQDTSAASHDGANQESPSDKIVHRVEALVEESQLASEPTFVLSATPLISLDARRMFESESDPLVQCLASPPEIREMGFDLDSGEYPQITDTDSRRAILDGYKGLQYWVDGTLVFVATGGEEFLSWGERSADFPFEIHPVVLLESTLLFCKLYRATLELLRAAPTTITYELLLRGMCVESKFPRLRPGRSDPMRSTRAASASKCDHQSKSSLIGDTKPARIAYLLVREVYTWCSLTYSDIPYLTERDGHMEVDIDQLRNL